MRIHDIAVGLIFLFSIQVQAAQTVYKVPNNNPSVQAFSEFKVEIKCVKEQNTFVIKYSYPKALTGVDQEVAMRQSRFDKSL